MNLNPIQCGWSNHITCALNRLKTGWSSSKVSEPLRPDEQAAIISVIRRNEEIEVAERQRVGKLVERVEKIKERAADCGPQGCRLCGQTFGILGPSRLVCEDCKKAVCSKCAIDINIKMHCKSREIWLCRICSETREMWKKSGAWFFKGLPKYEIPDPNLSSVRTTRSASTTPAKTVRIKKMTMSVVDTSSSEDDEVDDGVTKQTYPSIQRENSFRLKAVGSFRSFFDGGERKLSNSISFQRQVVSKSDCYQPDYDAISTVSSNRRESNYNNRRGSASSSMSISESSSGNGSITTSNQLAQNCRDPLLGWLELVVTYRENDHTLDCSIIRARDLPAMDSAGLTDPFCKLNIITPEGHVKYTRWQKTKTVHKTRNPEFNEILQFVGVEPIELGNSLLYVVILDDDKYGHDFLGAAKINLSTVHSHSPYRLTVPLGVEDQYSNEAEISQTWPRGKICISLCYNSKKRSLVVVVKQCINLLPMDNNGSSDPFVKLQLKPDTHKKKYKTGVKWRNLNPAFNEEFVFEASPHDLNKQSLIITVWDKDIGKSNDFLGSLILGCNSKGERLKQWNDCVRLPDHVHEKWHCLSADNPSH
ncbi:rabphilin-3A isoform X2 [Episyrphus balteatus]|uniref:rabphilin-3A isoform X2 n=1 Tax=Episyrphus balteatus TaxID=286459 RepID=UPI002485B10D|nr:rabphilin-3A isoform X2 [Episyrphus balteatus]